MKIEQIKKRIDEIKSITYDCEVVHIKEDDLFYDFVNAIKDKKYTSKEEIEELAKELYKVRKIEFSRWHA